ncbi:hypothetical protein KSP39_PZI015990 [Platanthera zijinensis]|uniref:Uncharacterized protein n=1 Tax=Platanthera zijinensis TaxID=2320716 RepID=A0AAP0B9K5_9ASPA
MADNGLAAMVGNLFSQSPTLLCQTISGSALNPNNLNMLYNNNNVEVIGSSSQSLSRDSSFMSATALLQKAEDVVAKFSNESESSMFLSGFTGLSNNPRARRSLPGTIKSYTNSTAPCMDTAARFVPFSDGGEGKTDLVHKREAGEKIVDVGNGKLTQDFLGLGASSSGNPSHYEEELDPYHQTSSLATTLETYMWQ